jgi:hypothetical protein
MSCIFFPFFCSLKNSGWHFFASPYGVPMLIGLAAAAVCSARASVRRASFQYWRIQTNMRFRPGKHFSSRAPLSMPAPQRPDRLPWRWGPSFYHGDLR